MAFQIKFELFEFSQVICRTFQPQGNLFMREGLKIEQAGVPPPNGFFFLNCQFMPDFQEPVFIDQPIKGIPFLLEQPDFINPRIIVIAKFFP